MLTGFCFLYNGITFLLIFIFLYVLFEMRKLLRNKKILYCGLFPNISLNEDDFEKYKIARGLTIEDPWLRVKSLFSKDEFGSLHPELINAIKMTQIGACIGAIFGGLYESKREVDNFIRTNDTNIYQNQKSAHRALNNKNILAFMNGALKWVPRFAFFCGGFTLISSCCELYRNKISVLDNVIGGFSIGALCKFHYGVKGMISGGIFGGIVGILYGGTVWCFCKLTDTDRMQIKYAQFALAQYNEQLKNHAKTPKDEGLQNLEKSGLYTLHITDPLNALDSEKNTGSKPYEVKSS